MTKNALIITRRIYSALMCIFLVTAGVCLITGCVSIYYSGDDPFTHASVAEVFSQISLPVYICLALAVIGFALELLLPSDVSTASQKNYKFAIGRLEKKRDIGTDEALALGISRERKKRRLHALILAVLFACSVGFVAVYMLDTDNFIKSDVLKNAVILTSALAVPFAYGAFTVAANEKSFKREIDIIKSAPLRENSENISDDVKNACSLSVSAERLRNALLLLAVVLVVLGLCMGGTEDVFAKAAKICTECIGLG